MGNVTVSAAGIQGPRGNTILSGIGAPSASTGVDGDYYGDTTNLPASWVLHGPKAAGAWPAGTITVSGGGVQLAGDLGGSSSSPQVLSTHLAAPLPVAQGGTGGISQASAQAALGLGSAATQASSAFDAAGSASTAEGAAIADAATKYLKLRPWLFDVTTSAYGAKGDGIVVTDGAITTGTAVLTSPGNGFGNVATGMLVMVKGAGPTGQTTHVTTVASKQSSGQITLASNAATTVSGALVMIASDDTAAIQSAINAALAYANSHGSATVFVPPGAGLFYGIGGALQSGGSTKGNAQLTLGAPVATNANKICLTIEGAGNGAALQHWEQTVPQTGGSTLVSFGVFANPTAQANSINAGGNPCVIGGPAQPGGYGISPGIFDNKLITLRNLSILTTHSAYGLTYSAADLSGVAEANLENLAYGTTGTVASNSDYTNPAQFANGLSIGLALPANGNNDNNRCSNVSCHGGYTYALFATEHTVIDRLCILYCWSALCLVGTYFGSVGAAHGVNVVQASIEACTNIVYVYGAGSSGIGPYLYATISTESGGPTFSGTNATAMNAALGTVTLTGLFTASGVNASFPTGLKVRNGQAAYPVVEVTSNYQVTIVDDTILVDATAGAVTVTLISAAWTPNTYTVKKIDSSANTVTVATTGGQTIDGASTVVLSSQWARATVAPARVSGTWNWYRTI